MDPTTWKIVEQVFFEAVELPPDQRKALVERLTKGQPGLAAEVFSLLESHDQSAGSFDDASPDSLRAIVDQAIQVLQETEPPQNRTIVSKSIPENVQQTIRQRVESLSSEYEFLSVIGRGGMGIVLKVLEKSLNRSVAMKMILDAQLHPERHHRFIKESRALAKINSDHIVRIYRVQDGEAPYILMEWIRGPSLSKLIARRRRLPIRFTAEIIRQACLGLQDAHDAGLIHRDIKPANILLQRKSSQNGSWRAKLVDFGLARLDDAELTVEDSLLGTPVYMSPEQLLHRSQLDRRSDIYSMGITLYELLVGEPPFRGTPHMIIRQIETQDPKPIRELDDRIAKDLESICMKAIAKEPRLRYVSAKEMADDLYRFLNGQPTIARPLPVWGRWVRWAARNRSMAASLATVTALVVLIAISSTVAASVLWNKNRVIAAQQARISRELCDRVVTADPDSLPICIDQIRSQIESPIPTLLQLQEKAKDQRSRFNISCALAALGHPTFESVIENIDTTRSTTGQCAAIVMALKPFADEARQVLKKQYAKASRPVEKVKLSILAMELDDMTLAAIACDCSIDPDLRTLWVHTLPNWHGDLTRLIDRLDTTTPVDIAKAICLGIGLLEPQVMSEAQNQMLESRLQKLVTESQDNGVLGAVRWLATRHGWLLQENTQGPVLSTVSPRPDWNWMLVHAGEFQMGNSDPALQYTGRSLHPVVLTRDFWLADREVNIRLYRLFLSDPNWPSESKPKDWENWQPDTVISPTDDHPVQSICWIDAVLFCNWLSSRHGLTPAYRWESTEELRDPQGNTRAIEHWRRISESNGYRLPTEAEFEFACRGGTSSNYAFGNDRHYLDYYAAWSNNTRIAAQPCGWLMPNPIGLFDMHGNVWEWVEDWESELPTTRQVDPIASTPSIAGRIFRGGGVCTFSGDPVSSSRGYARPDVRYNNLGLRLARDL